MAEAILELRDVHYSYGEIHAVKGISLKVYEDEIVSLIGANGAGKTTTLCAISGLLAGAATGDILFMGKRINRMSPHRIAALGLAHCLEGRHVFTQLTVRENLLMGAYLCKDNACKDRNLAYVFDLFPRLLERENQQAGTLSGGEQQMLAVGRALMQEPKVLMMDEPSLGLAPIIVQGIFDIIKRIHRDGTPVLLVEQNSKAALAISDRGYVLETGSIVLSDTAGVLMDNDEVRKAYLGG